MATFKGIIMLDPPDVASESAIDRREVLAPAPGWMHGSTLGLADMAWQRRQVLCREIRQRKKSGTMLQRNRRWLRQLGAAKQQIEQGLAAQRQQQAAQMEQFTAEQRRMRQRIRGEDASDDGDGDGDRVKSNNTNNNNNKSDSRDIALTSNRANARQAPPATSESPARQAHAVPLASSGEHNDDDDDGDDDDDDELEGAAELLDFASNLDFAKYIGDLNVRAGIAQLKARVSYLEENGIQAPAISLPSAAGEPAPVPREQQQPHEVQHDAQPAAYEAPLQRTLGFSEPAVPRLVDAVDAEALAERERLWDSRPSDGTLRMAVPAPMKAVHSVASLAELVRRTRADTLSGPAADPVDLVRHLPCLLRQ